MKYPLSLGDETFHQLSDAKDKEAVFALERLNDLRVNAGIGILFVVVVRG